MSKMTILVKTPAGLAFGSLVAFLAEKRMEFAVTNDGTNSGTNMSNMSIVVKTPAGPAFTSLVAFLADKIMEFAVTNDAPMEDSEASNASQASEDEPRMSGGRVKREEPELDAPSNMERVARNNKRLLSSRNVPKTFEDQSQLPTKRIKQEEPELPTIIPNKDSDTPKVENSRSREGAESMENNIADVENEMEELEEQPVANEKPSSSGTNMIELTRQRSHEKKNEDSMVPERESSKKVVCKTCDKSINGNRLTDRKRHALSHLKLKTWECTICHNSFSRSENGPRHFKTCHPDLPYVRLVRTT
ncbi:hypothetical protein B9Z55_007222 [Caenorhabditis nigoni]|nr:hypothetical protein B9Z55_007222 [Caenorhabditis nigoni]